MAAFILYLSIEATALPETVVFIHQAACCLSRQILNADSWVRSQGSTCGIFFVAQSGSGTEFSSNASASTCHCQSTISV